MMRLFGFFLVSALFPLGNTELADPPSVSHECKGKILCDIKPADYPDEEIDRLVRQNLHHLRRIRRQTSEEEIPSDESGLCASVTKEITPYSINDPDSLTVVQHQFLKQKINVTYCKHEGASCLESFTGYGHRYKCFTKTSDRYLTVKTKDNVMAQVPVKLNVNCACERFWD